jgi:hypothetical protein
LLFFASKGFANTIIMPTGVDWSRGEGIWLRENGQDVNAYFAGVIFIQLTDGEAHFNRDTLCVDLFTDINLNTTYETRLLTPAEVPGKHLERVSWLVDNALLPAEVSGIISSIPQSSWVRTPAQGAGIQLAIWDIVHDGGLGLSQGSVQAATDPAHPTDPAVVQWAQYYLSVSAGHSSNLAYIYDNTHIGTGDPAQMLAGPLFRDGGPTPAPEPGSAFMVGLALAGVAARFRRVRR